MSSLNDSESSNRISMDCNNNILDENNNSNNNQNTNPTVSIDEKHYNFMRLALEEANKAMEVDEVPVGCIFVDSETDQILSSAYNETNRLKNATRHCEFVCIDKLRKEGKMNFSSMILYVTVEPCIMCAAALQIIKIGKVYYGANNQRFGGCGSVIDINTIFKQNNRNESENKHSESKEAVVNEYLDTNYSYPVIGGILAAEAIQLLKEFYSRGNPNAPAEKRRRTLGGERNNNNTDANLTLNSTQSQNENANSEATHRENCPIAIDDNNSDVLVNNSTEEPAKS